MSKNKKAFQPNIKLIYKAEIKQFFGRDFLKCLILAFFILTLMPKTAWAKELPTRSFQAQKIEQNYQEIDLKPNKAFTFVVTFKNTGSQAWRKEGDGFTVLRVTEPTNRKSPFYHKWWKGLYEPAKMSEEGVSPGELATFRFALQASDKEGQFLEKFQVVIGDAVKLKGGEVEIIINVLEDFSLEYKKQVLGVNKAESQENASLVEPLLGEPNIRVGLFSTTEPLQITSSGAYEVLDAEDFLHFDISSGKASKITFDFNSKRYNISIGNLNKNVASYIKLVPKNASSVLEILNYEDRPKWNPELNDNKFRGILEIRFTPETEKLWVINELSLEDYLKGLGESSNSAPAEFQKALATAARTYAFYHLQNPQKHQAENFTVDAFYDQIYRGFNSEERLPKVSEAVLATKGLVVTYNNEIVVTPYFSQSDGRTRAWEEVWSGGPKAWLVSRPDPYNAGQTLLGHGVGMSSQGAIAMASAGSIFEEILQYYYTGVEIKKVY